MSFTFTPMTEDEARLVAAWRYEGDYAVYDGNDDPEVLALAVDRRSPYYAVRDEHGTFLGFFAYGSTATVGEEANAEPHLWSGEGVLSVGLGLAPDFTGQRRGLGLRFVEAGLQFAREQFAPNEFRLFVLSWNIRAIRVYERAGFVRTGFVTVDSPTGTSEFLEMRRPA